MLSKTKLNILYDLTFGLLDKRYLNVINLIPKIEMILNKRLVK